MIGRKHAAAILAALCLTPAAAASAATIYPINNAAILAGARFDFKVEFDNTIAQKDIKVTVNGKDYTQTLGQAEYVADEEGKGSAIIIRNVSLPAGNYEISAQDGGATKTVQWEVFATGERQAKNVILLIADGLSVGHRTGARLLSQGMEEGKYLGRLSMDTMPHLAFIGSSSVDSIATDSANSMSAYTTGHKSSINALGVYADRTASPFDDPRQETIAELIRRHTHMSVGIVSDAELQDATPAAVVGHTRRRDEKAALMDMFFDIKPDVLMGGGAAYFLPQSVPGSKRRDDKDFVTMFAEAGYHVVTSAAELTATPANTDKLLGLFHPGNMDGVLDRKFLRQGTVGDYPDQPDLTDMTRAALDILSKNPDGFFLMVEAGLVDKYAHPLDWERSLYDTIMFDQVIGIAREFAEQNPDTLIVVTGDHTHTISVIGTVDDRLPGDDMREKVGVYASAGFPLYADTDGDGYPDDVNPAKRLAVFFGATPDYYETFRPKMDGVFVPAVKDEQGRYIANRQYESVPGSVFRAGILPSGEAQGVHSVDDVLVHAQGPNADKFRGFMENTEVFKIMVDALGLGR